MKKIFSICFVLGSMVGLLGSNLAYAQNEYEKQVLLQLAIFKRLIEAEFDVSLRLYEYLNGTLNGGKSDVYSIRLTGNSYLTVGACDEDCKDIDLYLYDRKGRKIASNIEKDNVPYILIEKRRGFYSLEVEMYECDNDPCYYGIMILGR